MSEAKVVWTGVDAGYVEASDRAATYPFVFQTEGEGWRLYLHGGLTSSRLKGNWVTMLQEELDKEVLFLFSKLGQSCSFD